LKTQVNIWERGQQFFSEEKHQKTFLCRGMGCGNDSAFWDVSEVRQRPWPAIKALFWFKKTAFFLNITAIAKLQRIATTPALWRQWAVL
jgi:hypothetical protein